MPTILLVDDERIIRTLVRFALERRGYRVLDATTGRRALTLARRHHGPIDLLIAELTLPRMSGLALAATLGPERPEMRTLFLSRAPRSARAVQEARATGGAVLAEPFGIGDVLDLTARMLATRRRKPPASSPEESAPLTKTQEGSR